MTGTVEELLTRAHQARMDDRPQDALEDYAQAIAAAREEGLTLELIVALEGVGQMERDLGRLRAARDSYRNAVEESRAAEVPDRLAHALRHLADVERERGQVEEALTWSVEAVGIVREFPGTRPLELANTLRVLALAREAGGNFAGAREAWRDAREGYELAGIEAGVSECEARLSALDSTH